MDANNPGSKPILFHILYDSGQISIILSQDETIGTLKHAIFEKLEIPPSQQIINGWYREPANDDNPLALCCDSKDNYLVLSNSDSVMETKSNTPERMDEDIPERMDKDMPEKESRYSGLENCAAMDFIQYFSNNFDDRGILFHICRLEDALSQSCFTSLASRKILLLYFHNKSDNFAKIFGENLARPEVREMVNEKFFLLGWNLENSDYHPALIEALSHRAELSALANFVNQKICAALLIVPIKNSFTLFSCMKNKVSKKDFLETLKKAEEFLSTESGIEKDLEDMEPSSDTDINSANFQQMMLNLLGDRDYDSFDHFEFDKLKEKIGYAFFGPPEVEEGGYGEKQMKKINYLFDIIVRQNNIFTKWTDRIIISFIYNCTEPLPSEKKKRSKKFDNYNPNTDLTPIPIFILRKCKNSENPCRIIIDDNGRVYKTWHAYLTKNKLSECEMILPLNGRYQADETGTVILERHLSPACGIDSKILQGVDMANTAAGIVSGGIFIAAAIPTITVAPVALVAAGVTGIGVGLYSLGRSAYTLYDRNKHKETLSFANSEARGAYLSIVAGSLGFVGAGANMAVSQLAMRGFNIGQGATAAVNVINVANVGASGASVFNSGYDVFDQWWNENQVPSMLTIVQLSSSILFFGHAVYSFRLAGSIIEESQTRTLRDYHDSLRSNRHRKTFNKLMKETIRQNNGDLARGQADVIKTILNIPNKDEAFATLTRLNKQMNKNNVKFSASGTGDILLNGVKIDTSLFGAMDTNEVSTFLKTLPSTPDPTPGEVRAMNSKLAISFGAFNAHEVRNLAFSLVKIFNNTDDCITDKIISAVAMILSKLLKDAPGCFNQLNDMFPGCDKYLRLFTMVSGYFQGMISQVEEQYQKWISTKDPSFEEPYFSRLALDVSKRAIEIFEIVSRVYFMKDTLTEAGLKELIKYFYTWFTKQAFEFEEKIQRRQERIIHSGSPNRKARCPDCGGVYYH